MQGWLTLSNYTPKEVSQNWLLLDFGYQNQTLPGQAASNLGGGADKPQEVLVMPDHA